MGFVIRQSLHTSIINYLGVIIGAVNLMILFPILFGTAEIGLLRTIMSAALIVAQVAQFGIPNVVLKFYPGSKAQKEQGRLLSKLLLVTLVVLGACSLAIGLSQDFIVAQFEEKSPLFGDYFIWIFPIFLSSTLFNVTFSFARMENKLLFPFFLKELFIRLLNLVALGLFYLDFLNFDQFLMVFVFLYPLQLLVMWLFIAIRLPKSISFKNMFGKFPKSAQGYRRYAVLIFMSGISVVVLGNIDVVMVSKYQGLDASGIYTIAFFIAALIIIPARSMSIVLIPEISKAWQLQDVAKINSIYRKSALNNMIIGGAIFVAIVMNLHLIYQVMPADKGFALGIPVVLIVGLARVTDLMSGLNTEIIALSDKYHFDLIANIILLIVAITGNVLLIPEYGIVGAAWASFIAIVFNNILKFFFLLFVYGLQPFTYRHFIVVAACGIMYLGFWVKLPIENAWIEGILKTCVLFPIYGAIILKTSVSPDLNEQLKAWFPFLPIKVSD